MEPATWNGLCADFAFNGALIDLLAPGVAAPVQWETFWTALRTGPFELQAICDGEPIPLPGSAAAVFALREEYSVTISVRAGSITANCHFFGGDLELDIDPREVVDPTSFEAVLAVMRFVAATVGSAVVAVAEGGWPQFAFLSVTPDGSATYLPAGSIRATKPNQPD